MFDLGSKLVGHLLFLYGGIISLTCMTGCDFLCEHLLFLLRNPSFANCGKTHFKAAISFSPCFKVVFGVFAHPSGVGRECSLTINIVHIMLGRTHSIKFIEASGFYIHLHFGLFISPLLDHSRNFIMI